MEFTEILKRAMKEQGLNNREASRRCGIHENQFGKYVNGETEPKFCTALKILHALNWQLIPALK